MRPHLDAIDTPRPGPRSAAPFEQARGVTRVRAQGEYSFLSVGLPGEGDRHAREIELYRLLAQRQISINLVKLHRTGLSFVVNREEAAVARGLIEERALPVVAVPSVSIVSVYAAGMRGLCGVMGRIGAALHRAGIRMLQTGDGPDTVFCLVEIAAAERAVQALCAEFAVPEPRAPIVVQKFGGRSVATADARRLAARRVCEAIEAGMRPVVVVSAIGRKGEPYATDTLLGHLEAVDPCVEPAARERDMLMACGEIISTVIMAQTLRAMGLKAVALTGGQAGILTDPRYGDAQILDIDPEPIERLLFEEGVDVVVVAGFQGVTADGAITTLGRGGSDTTASALGAALRAESVEIYTHVNGVMTADPELVPEARTLSLVTYEEVCNMAHQGAKVLHPRAAEIAMAHGIPLWVKSSFESAPGTLVAPLGQIEPPVKRAVTGVATLSSLVYFTLLGLTDEERVPIENSVYQAVGEAGINVYLNSIGPETGSFLVDQAHAQAVRRLLDGMGLAYEVEEECELVSCVALNMWEVPGFLERIASALQREGIGMLQMADSECAVSCLVHSRDGRRAVAALHREFRLEG